MAKRVVLNLQEMRAQSDASVIVDQFGQEHQVGGLTLDAYLAILDFETAYEQQVEAESDDKRGDQTALIRRSMDLLGLLVPTFPVGGLTLAEMWTVIQAVQQASVPMQPGDGDGGGAAGE